MTDEPRIIRMFVDEGHNWPLWEDTHPTKCETEPADYNLSPELTTALRIWFDEWANGFDVAIAQWRPGCGRGWTERGQEIAALLLKEVESFASVEYRGNPW